MSKFIAMLCAATMLVSSTSIVLADDVVESEGSEGYDEFYEDSSILVSCEVIKIADIERMELLEEQP